CSLLVYFFFQAEDGIRDGHVTGVQTCALPISDGAGTWLLLGTGGSAATATARAEPPVPSSSQVPAPSAPSWRRAARIPATSVLRSEERRVGKECRSRGGRAE